MKLYFSFFVLLYVIMTSYSQDDINQDQLLKINQMIIDNTSDLLTKFKNNEQLVKNNIISIFMNAIVYNTDYEVVKYLLELDIDSIKNYKNVKDETIIMWASGVMSFYSNDNLVKNQQNRYNIIKLMIDNNFEVNAKSIDGYKALDFAIFNINIDSNIVKLLLEKTTITRKETFHYIEIASKNNRSDIIPLFIPKDE